MTPLLSPIASKSLAVAILCGLTIGIYLAIVQPLTAALSTNSDAIAQLDDAVTRYGRVAAELAPLQAELAAKGKDQQDDGLLLHGANETLIAADIQNKLKELVAGAQGELSSSQVLPGETDGRLRRIGVRGQVTISLEGAQRVFRDLEQGQPLLFVDNVDIRSDDGSRRRRQRGATPGTLQIRLDVYGFTRPATAPEGSAPVTAVKPHAP